MLEEGDCPAKFSVSVNNGTEASTSGCNAESTGTEEVGRGTGAEAGGGVIGSLDAAKKSIHEELSQLDTRMPNLDFSKLEEQLNNAVREREMNQRKVRNLARSTTRFYVRTRILNE